MRRILCCHFRVYSLSKYWLVFNLLTPHSYSFINHIFMFFLFFQYFINNIFNISLPVLNSFFYFWQFRIRSTLFLKCQISKLQSFRLLKVIKGRLKHILQLPIFKYLILNLTHFLNDFIIWCIYSQLLILSFKFDRHILILSFECLKLGLDGCILFFLFLIKLMKESYNFHYVLVLLFEVYLFLYNTPNLKSCISIFGWVSIFELIIDRGIWGIVTSICQILFVLEINQVLLFHYFRHSFVYQSCKTLVSNSFTGRIHGSQLFLISISHMDLLLWRKFFEIILRINLIPEFSCFRAVFLLWINIHWSLLTLITHVNLSIKRRSGWLKTKFISVVLSTFQRSRLWN